MPWTALSSELGTLKSLHGANVLLFLNVAYFAPSLPILVTQLVRPHDCQCRLHRVAVCSCCQWQQPATFLCIGCVGNGFWDHPHIKVFVEARKGSMQGDSVCSVAQCMQFWDPKFNRQFGAAKATLFRQCVALPLCFLCSIILPYLSWTRCAPLVSQCIIGLRQVCLSMVSQVSPACPPRP